MKNKLSSYLYIYTFILLSFNNINLFISNANASQKYYIVISETTPIKILPNKKSKDIGKLKYCDKVLLLEETKVMENINNYYTYMFKIKTENNIIGFVFSGDLSEYEHKKYILNDKPFNIKGRWSMYYDEPNTRYYFLNNNIFKEEHYNDNKTYIINGFYKYDGCCKILITLNNNKKYYLNVIKIDGNITLKQECFFFDPELFKKLNN